MSENESIDAVMRRPHAVLDVESRYKKALKIERLLELSSLDSPIRLLDIGTGSGGIAAYFANHQNLRCQVSAVDMTDQRLLRDGYHFEVVRDTSLPFPPETFDVVVSNHVIEHVGDRKAQFHHLTEIHRVLSRKGRCYFAVPNRWMLFEPHYKIPFLSWLPIRYRTPYLRFWKRGDCYDCQPLTLREARAMLLDSGFEPTYLSTKALRETFEIEGCSSNFQRLISKMPDAFFDFLTPINPTLIFSLTRQESESILCC